MARIRTDKKTGAKRLTLSWTSERYAAQERILSQFQKSGDVREFVMQAILIAQAAKDTGIIPADVLIRQQPVRTQTNGTPPQTAKAADALKKFKL